MLHLLQRIGYKGLLEKRGSSGPCWGVFKASQDTRAVLEPAVPTGFMQDWLWPATPMGLTMALSFDESTVDMGASF